MLFRFRKDLLCQDTEILVCASFKGFSVSEYCRAFPGRKIPVPAKAGDGDQTEIRAPQMSQCVINFLGLLGDGIKVYDRCFRC